MKKNLSAILLVVIALAGGYFLGAEFGFGGANAEQTKGDINAINSYHMLLTVPENMAFSKENAKDDASIQNTITTLQVVQGRISEFNSLSHMVIGVTGTDVELNAALTSFCDANDASFTAYEQTNDALTMAFQLQKGEKVDLKEGLKNATAGYNALLNQMAAGKAFVEAVDAFLKDKDVKEHIMTATLRDMVASHCAVNATLTQSEQEQDYWLNLNELLTSDQMADIR